MFGNILHMNSKEKLYVTVNMGISIPMLPVKWRRHFVKPNRAHVRNAGGS